MNSIRSLISSLIPGHKHHETAKTPAPEEKGASINTNDNISLSGKSAKQEETKKSAKHSSYEPAPGDPVYYTSNLIRFFREEPEHENGIDGKWAIDKIIASPNLSENQYDVLKTIATQVRKGSRFERYDAFADVCKQPNISDTQKPVLNLIVDATRFHNNDLNENLAFSNVLHTPDLNDKQAGVISNIIKRAQTGNFFNEDEGIYTVLKHPRLSDNHVKILTHIVNYAHLDNDIDKDRAFYSVCTTDRISNSKLDLLLHTFDNANANNGINDTKQFLYVLEHPAPGR